MPFSDSAKAQDKSAAALWSTRLIGVPDDAWIEQGRRFERILVKKIGTDQRALCLAQYGMRLERLFHFCSAGLEDLQ